MNKHKWLAESENFKVYSIYDYAYIKDKRISKNLNQFEQSDKHIQWIYGEPNGAIILPKEDKTIIVGSGIYIYDILTENLKEFYNNPDEILWIDTIYQNGQDDPINEFRIVAYNENDQLGIFKFSMLENKLIELK